MNRFSKNIPTTARILLVLSMFFVLVAGSVFAQDNGSEGGDSAAIGTTSTGDFEFRFVPAVPDLVADNVSETTLVAFLSASDGSPIAGEDIRFVLQNGQVCLGAPEVGEEETVEEVAISQNQCEIAVDAQDALNGVYYARVRASEVSGTATIIAQWLSAPVTPLPQVTTQLNLLTAEDLVVRVDDPILLSDGEDRATIIAYVRDGLNKPVRGADVTFRILNGAGRLEELPNTGGLPNEAIIEGVDGRYVATYTASNTPGTVTIEVALPTITNPIRQTVNIEVVEAGTLSAQVFPSTVSRPRGQNDLATTNTANILVAVRDGDGELVRGLSDRDLRAQVISGPGDVTETGIEISLEGGDVILDDPEATPDPDAPEARRSRETGSGVYHFTFNATDTTGESLIQITNLASPSRPTTEVSVNTVTDLSPGTLSQVSMTSFSEDPLFSDGESQALVVSFVADEDGNHVRNPEQLATNFLIVSGQGELLDDGVELPVHPDLENRGVTSTSIWTTTYLTGNRNVDNTVEVRSVFSSNDGQVVSQTLGVNVTALAAPEVVVFPNPIPTGRQVFATVDIYDINDQTVTTLEESDLRYRIDIESGPGTIASAQNDDDIQSLNSGANLTLEADGNRAALGDVVANDDIWTGIYFVEADSASQQEVRFNIVDTAISGFPSTSASLQIGQDTMLTAFVTPATIDPGDEVQIVVFASDEFGDPSTDHELRLTIVEGSATALNGSELVDNGGELSEMEQTEFIDAFADDGVYVGAIRASGIASGTIRVRVTDLTPPSQPTVDLDIPVSN